MLPDGLVNVEEPLHAPVEIIAGERTAAGTAGTGAAGSAGAGKNEMNYNVRKSEQLASVGLKYPTLRIEVAHR